MKRAFIFPGQGSQFIEMGKNLYENFTSAKDVFNEINDALHFNLSDLIFNGTIEELSLTENTQPALMAVSAAIIAVLAKDFKFILKDHVNFVMGHSLGEYSAYTAANSIILADTAKLLKIRGKAMQNASPHSQGAMIALLGATIIEAENIVNRISTETNIINIANDNCPGQIVLSGTVKAIDDAILISGELGFKAIKLKVSAAFHSELMLPAQSIMYKALNEVSITNPKITLISNISAKPVIESEIRTSLVKQITDRVRWHESIKYLIDRDVSEIIEIGAGTVLTNLNKRIDKNIKALAVSSPIEIEQFVKTVNDTKI